MFKCISPNFFLHFNPISKDFLNIHENKTQITYLLQYGLYNIALFQPVDSIFSTLELLVAKIQVYLKVYLYNLFHFFSQFHKFH